MPLRLEILDRVSILRSTSVPDRWFYMTEICRQVVMGWAPAGYSASRSSELRSITQESYWQTRSSWALSPTGCGLSSRGCENSRRTGRQVILTTHSPISLENLDVEMLRVVRSADGTTVVSDVPGVLEAGHAELAADREIRSFGPPRPEGGRWGGRNGDGILLGDCRGPGSADLEPASLRGVTVMNGSGGTDAPRRALALRELGFEAALMIDNDGGSDPADVNAATAAVASCCSGTLDLT